MANDATLATASSSLDFAGLARLRSEAQKKSGAGNREAAQQFEAMFVQMMLKSMRDATFKGGMLDSKTMDTYMGMHDRELSLQIARNGSMGIASMLEKQFSQTQTTAADVLAQRQKSGEDAAGLPMVKPLPGPLPLGAGQPAYEVKRPAAAGFDLQREFMIHSAP